ncbi:outer membrane beta-barrel protein [Flavobacterium sp.]|uniref:outer membrane beta-barrel protein n=1 Tax=Flavobacterium sp. TaxID=239 RepID=UPI00352765EA
MKHKKNIENLFQEKFKNFEVQPPQDAWKNIEAKLNKKEKKRRFIPFWFKVAGVAAGLAFFVTILFKNNTTTTIKTDGNTINNTIVNQEELDKTEKSEENKVFENEEITAFSTIVATTNSENKEGKNNKHNNKITVSKTTTSYQQQQSELAQNKEIAVPIYTNAIVTEEQNKEKENRVIALENKAETIEKQTEITLVENEEKENELEKLLKQKDEEGENADEKEEKRSKWAVSSTAAPVYFNSFSNESALDSKFNSNSKSYQNSISYGVGVQYAITTKLSIRTGVSKMNLSHETNEVAFYQNENAAKMNNILPTAAATFINLDSKVIQSPRQFIADPIDLIKYDGTINQKYGFIEVPVELSYAFVQKNRLNLEIIGGFSTLFLNENSVSLVTNQTEIPIGKATNISDVSFSGNFGIGISYRLFKSLSANLQPTFKYQINTFDSSTTNFNPYTIGLYTGLSYKF